MSPRASALSELLRGSLFLVPMTFILAAVVLAGVTVAVDRELLEGPGELPFVLTSTVDSARAVLGTIASATITVAGIAFSISLLVIQLASSQYSPRIVHDLLEILALLDQRAGGDADVHAALAEQAGLIRAAARTADLLPEDVERIESAHDARFGA